MSHRKGLVTSVVGTVARWTSSKAKQDEREYESANPAHSFDRAEQGAPSIPSRSNNTSGSIGAFNKRSSSAQNTLSYGSVNYFGIPDGVPRLIHSSPERRRSRDSVALLNRVPEEGTMEREHEEEPRYAGGVPLDYAESDSEEEEWELDQELADRGLYRGSYKRLVAMYTFTPFTALVAFILLSFLPSIIYPIKEPPLASQYPYAPYLPFPFPEVLTATAMWSLAYLLHTPLYAIASIISSPCRALAPYVETLLATSFQTTSVIFLRQAAIPILLIPHYAVHDYPTWEDSAFRRVWWVALGWAAAEAVVGIVQGYKSLGLYKEVLVTIRKTIDNAPNRAPAVHKSDPELTPTTIRPLRHTSNSRSLSPSTTPSGSSPRQGYGSAVDVNAQTTAGYVSTAEGERQPLLRKSTTDSVRQEFLLKAALEMEVERDLDQLIALKRREDLEDAYGMPFIHIPVSISCLHRINALLSSVGTALLLSAAYMRSTLSEYTPPAIPYLLSYASPTINIASSKSNTYLAITLPIVLSLQIFLSILHTPLVLPRIGVHTFVYLSLLVSLGMLFSGLSVWKALS